MASFGQCLQLLLQSVNTIVDIHFIQVIDAECVIFKHEGEFCDSDFLSAMGRIKAA
jgi:hypothetical protein